MKDKKKKSKLALNKETIVRLEDESLRAIRGGDAQWTTIGSQVWSLGCRCTTGCTNGPVCNYTEAQCGGSGAQ
jgi:natural product precursor